MSNAENNHKWCIGLTGGLASGKTAVSRILASLGAFVADADEAGRALTADADAEGTKAVRHVLGEWAFDESGCLRRDAVRQRVFADATLRQQLEEVLHPLIQSTLQLQLQDASGDYAVISAPLLLESDMLTAVCARIAVVDCAPETQIQRAVTRDGISPDLARAIAAAQMPRQKRLARADDVINNDGSLQVLQKTVESFHQTWTTMAKHAAVV